MPLHPLPLISAARALLAAPTDARAQAQTREAIRKIEAPYLSERIAGTADRVYTPHPLTDHEADPRVKAYRKWAVHANVLELALLEIRLAESHGLSVKECAALADRALGYRA